MSKQINLEMFEIEDTTLPSHRINIGEKIWIEVEGAHPHDAKLWISSDGTIVAVRDTDTILQFKAALDAILEAHLPHRRTVEELGEEEESRTRIEED